MNRFVVQLMVSVGVFISCVLLPAGSSAISSGSTAEYIGEYRKNADQTGPFSAPSVEQGAALRLSGLVLFESIVKKANVGKVASFIQSAKDWISGVKNVREEEDDEVQSDFEPLKSSKIPSQNEVLLGAWVEARHRNDGVFGKFNSALVGVTLEDIREVFSDARKSQTKLIVQLGATSEWGWNFKDSTSTFTVTKWKHSVNRFADDPEIRALIQSAIDDGLIRSIYLIDEPHHVRWSPERDSNVHIKNSDLESMAGHVKAIWPNVSTSVRASPRALISYGRERKKWRHLDEAFLMINYRKWSKHGDRTIEGFMERELFEAYRQGLGVIGSVQMLIGAPKSERKWWPDGIDPSGKLRVSPRELQTYVDTFLAKRDLFGARSTPGKRKIDTVMIFRWDRNNEKDWQSESYQSVLSELIDKFDTRQATPIE